MDPTRRRFLKAGLATPVALWLSGCGGDNATIPAALDQATLAAGYRMPAEEHRHDATWMCFPGRADVWGRDLPEVKATIADIALAIAEFEPVRMLVQPDDLAQAQNLVGSDIDLIEAPVDDLWARDTLPLFVVSEEGELAAGRVRFNGWGDKQTHDGDATLAALVADVVGVELIDAGLVGEGGGLETDGEGTLLAARSSWINDNRNPGVDEATISDTLAALLGADRVLWVDGIAGEDITDGHIDTLARFANPQTIVHEFPSYIEPGETWYDLAIETADALAGFTTTEGNSYELVRLDQPATTRRDDAEFLASYVNYYVCNGAVIAPQFGDAPADDAAADLLASLYPDREVVRLDIDPVSAGGGGIHCATQQQPAT